MNFVYNIIAHIAFFFIRIVAIFSPKMKLFVRGRKVAFAKLKAIKLEDKVMWFHAASLGEFEQARPIIEEVKRNYPQHKIVVTFFSPSGYEIRKKYALADVVCYLPFDTKSRMRKFVKCIHPEMAIIVKYEFWPNLLNELNKQSIPTILVSGIFRKEQAFFKPRGKWMRKSLMAFEHFFVQNETSKELLKGINFTEVSVSGDTRFDRVVKILEQDNTVDFVSEFKNNQYTVVAGSTWQEGEKLLVDYINNSKDEKLIIAPHNIKAKETQELKASIQKKTVLFSEREGKQMADFDVLIIDTIGLLTKVYSYADVAYVGGAFRTGLHNILEPATFGVPIVIGPEFDKFNEAQELVEQKGCFSVKNSQEFSTILKTLKKDDEFRKKTGQINQKYIEENKGATKKIMTFITQKINK
jgi:3-deoxy-D-manno-octulosonic-acid transferase